MFHYIDRLERAKEIVDAMLNSNRYFFDKLKPSDLQDGLAVVYAIFEKDSDICLYVGRTKNLRQRLYTNHLMGSSASARLKKYLCKDSDRPDIISLVEAKNYLKNHCYFQYIPISDMRERGQIEGLIGYFLNVYYIHEEH